MAETFGAQVALPPPLPLAGEGWGEGPSAARLYLGDHKEEEGPHPALSRERERVLCVAILSGVMLPPAQCHW